MTRRVFYSFDYTNDVLRASQVREIGSITPAGRLAHGNDWETVKRKDDATIKKWIGQQMHGTSAVVVLIGEKTSESRWVKYEIEQGWKKGKGVLGIHIHNLQCPRNGFSPKGKSPFDGVIVAGRKREDAIFSGMLPKPDFERNAGDMLAEVLSKPSSERSAGDMLAGRMLPKPDFERNAGGVLAEMLSKPRSESSVDDILARMLPKPDFERNAGSVLAEMLSKLSSEPSVDDMLARMLPKPNFERNAGDMLAEVLSKPSSERSAGDMLAGMFPKPGPDMETPFKPIAENASAGLSASMVNTLNLGEIVEAYDPREDFLLGETAYHDISNKLEGWIEKAIKIRGWYA